MRATARTLTRLVICVLTMSFLGACNTVPSLTREEYAIQSAVDAQVALTLFERDLSSAAS